MDGYRPDPHIVPAGRGAAPPAPAAQRLLSVSGSSPTIWDLYTESVTRPERDLQTERLNNFTWRLRHSQALFAWQQHHETMLRRGRLIASIVPDFDSRGEAGALDWAHHDRLQMSYPPDPTLLGQMNPYGSQVHGMSQSNRVSGSTRAGGPAILRRSNQINDLSQIGESSQVHGSNQLGGRIEAGADRFQAGLAEFREVQPSSHLQGQVRGSDHIYASGQVRGPGGLNGSGQTNGPDQVHGSNHVNGSGRMRSSNQLQQDQTGGSSQPAGHPAPRAPPRGDVSRPRMTAAEHISNGLSGLDSLHQVGSEPLGFLGFDTQFPFDGFQLDNVPLAFNGLEDSEWLTHGSQPLAGLASSDAPNDALIEAALHSGDFSLQPLQMYNFFDTQELLPSIHHDSGDMSSVKFEVASTEPDVGMELEGEETSAASSRTGSALSSRRASTAALGSVSKPVAARKKKTRRSPGQPAAGPSGPRLADSPSPPSTAPSPLESPPATAKTTDAQSKDAKDEKPKVPAAESLQCSNCTTFTTPLWRRDDMGNALCNACGLFFKLHGVNRPMKLKTDVIKRRNRQGPDDVPPVSRRRSRRRAERGRPAPIAPTPPKMSPPSRQASELPDQPADARSLSGVPGSDLGLGHLNSGSHSAPDIHSSLHLARPSLGSQSSAEPPSGVPDEPRQFGVSAGALDDQRAVNLDPVRDLAWSWPSVMQ